MNWEHGYFTGVPYTANFFREVAPIWLDFAALLRGYPSPRTHEGTSFSYLELGSGMGLGLCLLAAAYPEASFMGIDFMPEHIAHSRNLARRLELANVRFLEADLLDLAADPSPLHRIGLAPASCHYVVAHGLL